MIQIFKKKMRSETGKAFYFIESFNKKTGIEIIQFQK